MKLRAYLKKEGLSLPDFHARLVKAGLVVSLAGTRKWASGERIPRRDAMPVILKVTRGKVTAADFFAREAA